MNTHNTQLKSKLSQLKSDFAVTMRRRLTELHELHNHMAKLTVNGSDYLLALNKLHLLAHSIAGSSATFGCHKTHEAAARMESRVVEAIESLKPGDDFTDFVAQCIKKLEQAISTELDEKFSSNIPRYSGLPLHTDNNNRRPLVYIVDDDGLFLEDISNTIKTAGYDVITFEDTNHFKQEVRLHEPDVIIMDIVFPDDKAAGITTINEIQQGRETPIPVIYTSNHDSFHNRYALLKAGGARYFNKKPINYTDLLQSLDMVLRPHNQVNKPRVLIIEDDEPIAEYHSLLLTEAGLDVFYLTDPTQTLETLESFNPDVVVIDLYMPEINGADLANLIRLEQKYQYLSLVFLSSESDSDKQFQALRAGGDDFLTKPVDPSVFISFISHKARQSRNYISIARELEKTIAELEQFKIAMDEHAIVSVADTQGNITYANSRFLEISKYSIDELLGRNHNILNSGYHDQAFFEVMWDTISSGNIWQGVICNRDKEGDNYWVESSIVPFMDSNGLPYQYVSIRTDITRIKLIEEELRINEERLRRSQQYANIGTWDWNIETGELYWSEQVGPLFGYNDLVETTYDNFIQAVHPDDRKFVSDAVTACVEQSIPYDIEHRIINADGQIRWLSEKGDVVRDQQGRPLHMLGVVQDITVRKLAQNQLIEAQKLAQLGNWEANLITGDLYWSDVIYTIFGHQPHSFKPSVEAFRQAIHPDDVEKVQQSEKRAEETGVHNVVHRIIRPDGEVRYVHELARHVHDESGRSAMLTGTVQDVTDLKLTEENLIKAKEEAERASRAKSDFLSRMSHELRTPMNAILGFAQLLETEDINDEQHESVEQILRAGWHLLELINEVLDLSRIESGNMELELKSVDLSEVLTECEELVQPLSEQNKVSIIIQPGTSTESLMVMGDRTRLKQVILNLLSNAIKYNNLNGEVRLSISYPGESQIRLSIIDTGPGIPAEKMEDLFEPFNRLDAHNSNIEGTGIGLVISRHLAELMGGGIGVKSTVGTGSEFWIDLLASNDSSVLKNDIETKDMAANMEQSHSSKVVYVEDNPANTKLVSKLISNNQDISLQCYETAEEALEHIDASIDLILMDINLPGMNGFAALKEVHKQYPQLPIIALSANAMPEEIERAIQAGFNEYLTKPIDVMNFKDVISKYLQ